MELPSTKKQINPYENLERMLNKTTLSTQRLAHRQIIGECKHLIKTRKQGIGFNTFKCQATIGFFLNLVSY